MSMNLKKFMNLANSMNINSSPNQSIVYAYDFEKSKILKDYTNMNLEFSD